MNVNVRVLRRIAIVGFGSAMTLGLAMPTAAVADPGTASDYGLLAAVGSDTTQDVMNGYGAILTNSDGDRLIASWDATGSSTVTTKDATSNANCTGFVRPNGSSAGRNALIASEIGTTFNGQVITDCVDLARSSAGPRSSGTTYTYVPFGVDAVTVAINTNSFLPTNYSLAVLRGIYQCSVTQIAGVAVTPVLPQSGSGTRSYWLSQMNITETDISNGLYPCLTVTVQENDGTALTGHNDYIMPFSASQYIAQGNATAIASAVPGVTVTDRHGEAILASIAGVAPVVSGVLNTSFTFVRDVYNVIPTHDLTDETFSDTFVGTDSAVCSTTVTYNGVTQRVMQWFGFGYRETTVDDSHLGCGATTLTGDS